MKAISMWQPHGSLLTTGAKPFETRSWSTKFRGPVLIHAAARFVRSEWEFYLSFSKYKMGLAPLLGMIMNWDGYSFVVEAKRQALAIRPADIRHQTRVPSDQFIAAVPRGAFIGMGELVDCIPVEKMTEQQLIASRGFGDFSDGRLAWQFEDVKRFKNPIPAKGHQGFFYASVDLAGNELIPV